MLLRRQTRTGNKWSIQKDEPMYVAKQRKEHLQYLRKERTSTVLIEMEPKH